jgi:quercetin dioxygenase-like cupin family protein
VDGNKVVRDGDGAWEPSKIPGVTFRTLHAAGEKNAGTYLVRMSPGTRYPPHVHPKGEEVFVVSGSMRVGRDSMVAGDYLFTPPGAAHDAETAEGCVFLVVLPAPAQFLK